MAVKAADTKHAQIRDREAAVTEVFARELAVFGLLGQSCRCRLRDFCSRQVLSRAKGYAGYRPSSVAMATDTFASAELVNRVDEDHVDVNVGVRASAP